MEGAAGPDCLVGLAEPREAAVISALQSKLFPGDPNSLPPAHVKAPASDPHVTILAARHGSQVTGFLVLRDRALRPWTSIDFVAVDPGSAGQGFGRLLVEAAFRHASRPILRLFVRPSNVPARALYAQLGFRHTATRKRNYTDGEDALVLMRWIGPRGLRSETP